MANEEHLAILEQGVEKWNRWREENPTLKPNLGRADLTHADLRGINLTHAYLWDADLSRAHLRNASLGSADLREANINRADLSFANLLYTNCG